MIVIDIITSPDPTPADAVTESRAFAAVHMISEADCEIRTMRSDSPEALEICGNVISADEALRFYGDEYEEDLIGMWFRRREEEFSGLPVRLSAMWNREYDNLTESVRQEALRHERIMTPVVYINGNLIGSGKAAKPCEIEKCIKNQQEKKQKE